jgi:hypothetical protein
VPQERTTSKSKKACLRTKNSIKKKVFMQNNKLFT